MPEPALSASCPRCQADLHVVRLGRSHMTVGLERSARADPAWIPTAKGRYAYPSNNWAPTSKETLAVCGGIREPAAFP